MGRTESIIDELLAPGELLANEAKQDAQITHLANIAGDVKPLSGAGTAGTLALASADTWYSCPSTVPASDYVLIVSKENAAGTIRWAFSDGAVPSATYGNRLSNNDLIVEMAANAVLYVGSSNAGDDVNWTCKII